VYYWVCDTSNAGGDLLGHFRYHSGNDLRGVAVSNKVAVLGEEEGEERGVGYEESRTKAKAGRRKKSMDEQGKQGRRGDEEEDAER
jgi:hypothetical protein